MRDARSSKPRNASANQTGGRAKGSVEGRWREPTSRVSVVLIEPNSLIREGFAKVLESTRFCVIASCSVVGELPSSLVRSPELILVGGDDYTTVRSVLQHCVKQYPTAQRVVLTSCGSERLMAIIESGAHCCIGRDVSIEVLLKSLDLAILKVGLVCQCNSFVESHHTGENSWNGEVTETAMSDGINSSPAVRKLSEREIAILRCLMRGDANKVIGRKLQLAEATVKVHIKSILRKIRLANRTQAAIWAQTNLTSRSIEALHGESFCSSQAA